MDTTINTFNESIETIFDHDKQNELLVKIIRGNVCNLHACFSYFCILDENLNMYIDNEHYGLNYSLKQYLTSHMLQFELTDTIYISNIYTKGRKLIKKTLTSIQCGTLTLNSNEFISNLNCCDNLIEFLNDPSNYPSSVPILK